MKQILTRELLEDLYTKQKLSIKKIVELTKNSTGSIRRKIEEYELIKELTKEERIKQKGKIIVSVEEIKELYINQKLSIETIAKKYNVSKSKIKNLLELYQISQRTEEERFTLIYERSKETLKEKYGVEHPYQIPKIRDRMIEKVQSTYATGIPQEKIRASWQNKEILYKAIKTKRQNGTLNFSKPEEDIYQLLLTKFNKEDVIRQYSTPIYKWPCDFYIKSLDLYIEYQGSWVHGNQPFDPNNPIHQKIVKKWEEKNTEYFNYAIKIWTIRDPLKRETVRKNNLNWLEFFTFEEVQQFLGDI